jgi:2-amino-4-hydroxy-6-hydroxymethyldihydropteridine diphosphokinase
MEKVFIGLGSNLDDPLSQIKKAIEYLKKLNSLNVINISNFYSSPPMGPQDQPKYINAVVEVTTRLSAEQLLDELQKIENIQGRERKQHWGARTLDLDILLYGNDVINTERLIIPHKGISERDFVLSPLRDLVKDDFMIPKSGLLSELLAACSMTGVKRLNKV